MHVKVDIRHDTLYMTQIGDYDADAYLCALADILRMSEYVVGMSIIVDARGLTTPASSLQLQAIRSALQTPLLLEFRPRRYAIVYTAAVSHLQIKLAATLIAQFVGKLPADFQLGHFTSVEEAEDWLRTSVRESKDLPAEADARTLPRSSDQL